VTTVLHAEGICLPGPFGVGAAGVAPEIQAGWVAFDGEWIEDAGTGAAPAGAVDLGAVVLAPAFVDLQVNGLGGIDLAGAAPAQIADLARELGRHGVGAFCPTLTSHPADAYGAWLDRIAEARRDAAGAGPATASLLGAHLEGPFLGGAPGAHDRLLLRAADVPWLERLLDAHHDEIAMVTLAPEADPGLAATRMLAGRGITVALGHSRAAHDVIGTAVDAGATVVTHLFNAMGPLHHRAPGLVGAALADPRLTPTVIGDGVHVHPDVLRIVFAAKPRVALVSDTVATGTLAGATGGPRETHGAARLADGTLAGATVSLERAVANVVALGVPLRRVVAMATEIPADLVRAVDRGRLAAGARADVVALDPRDASVRAVWLGGCEVRR
jgi:N-acetylglucosamine-6-phosphate deacetylase